MPRRRCLGCNRLVTTGSRCPSCAAARKRRRNNDAAAARLAVTLHRAEHGDWCPGWNRPPHPSDDLTAEHPAGIDAGRQVLEVLCRSCNARKGQPNASSPQAVNPATIQRRPPRPAPGIW